MPLSLSRRRPTTSAGDATAVRLIRVGGNRERCLAVGSDAGTAVVLLDVRAKAPYAQTVGSARAKDLPGLELVGIDTRWTRANGQGEVIRILQGREFRGPQLSVVG